MQPTDSIRKRAPRLLLTLTAFVALSLSSFAPLVSAADTTAYSAAQIHDWLVDAISSTEVTVGASPSITVDEANNRMLFGDPDSDDDSLTIEVRGVLIGLNYVRVTFSDSDPTLLKIDGELDLFGKYPKFYCNLYVEYDEEAGAVCVAGIEDGSIKVADFTPSLATGDLNTIADVLNQVLDAAGGLPVTPDGAFEGIGVDAMGVFVQWANSQSHYTPAQMESRLDGMATTLAQKATECLQEGEGDWSIGVDVVSDTSLDIDASLTAFGITAAVSDMAIMFDELTASVTDAVCSIGTATKEFTMSFEAEIGCSNYVPWVTMTSLSAGGDHAGFNDFISGIEAALLDAISQAAGDIVEDTGLTWPYASISAISVVGTNVVLHEGGEEPYLIVGDVNLDERTNIIDAMFIAQYVVGLRTLDADQLKCADTTADRAVNIIDAMHIAQFSVDPRGTAGVLFKPLFDPVFHQGMIDPLTL